MNHSIRAHWVSRVSPLTAMCLLAVLSTAQADDAAVGAAAAPAPAATESAERGSQSLQEVVVTATRHEESLSKVPISVTALTQDAMDSRGIKDFQDIARYTPGVSIDNSATNAISIRGISSSAGAGTTGIYIDDTPIQMRSVGFNPDDALPKTFDLERVEILRGPQGTLFGAGAEGGAVRYILVQPSVSTASSTLRSEVSYTEHGQPNYELGVAHGQPIVDGTFGVRASVWYRWDGGWIDRVDPTTRQVVENNINHSGTLLARLAAIWQPSESVSVTPSILYQNLQKHDDSTYWPAYSNAGAGNFNTATPERIPNDDQYYLPSVKLQWDLGKSQIIANASYFHRTQITAYQGTVYDLGYYQTAGAYFGIPCVPTPAATATCPGPVPLIDGNGIHLPSQFANYQTPNVMTNSQENYSGELRWQSNDEAAKLHWTTGVFWQLAKEGSIEELKDTQINALYQYLYGTNAISLYCPPGTNPATCAGPPDFLNSSASPDYSCPTNVNYTAIPACDIYYNNNTTFDRQIAIYGELSYAFTDWFRLTLGERFAHTEFSLTHYADGLENFGPYPGVVRASEKESPNTPKAVASFQVDPKDLFYVSYAKGFRVGGGNAPLPPYCGPGAGTPLNDAGYPNGAPLTYKSDSTQNYEIGSKNTIGENLRIATSVYYIKWNNIQQNIYVAGACGLQFTDNLGEAVAWGGDLQAELALGHLNLDLATGYTSARFTKNAPTDCAPYLSPATTPPGIPCKTSNGDAISGQAAIDYAPGTNPPFTVALGAEYTFRLVERDAFARIDWTYQSRNPWLSYLQDPRNAATYNPYSYTLSSTTFTTVRAGVYLGDWQISLFVDNLFDSARVTNYALGQPSGAPTVQENDYTYRPRTFGINANWHVGH